MNDGRTSRYAGWDDDEDYGYGYGHGYGYGDHHRAPQGAALGAALAPLVRQMRRYDALRQQLETEGGVVADLLALTGRLGEPIALASGTGKPLEIALADPDGVRAALARLGEGGLRLQVRRLKSGLPAYYLCRGYRYYGADYQLVLQDLYLSPGYPLSDERFVKLMNYAGHEVYALRLAPFRARVLETLVEGAGDAAEAAADRLLCRAGNYVLQAAWHDDQRPALQAALHFRLPIFLQAVELLYLCLSAELCELRDAVDAPLRRFFAEVLPQPALAAFLGSLAGREGDALSRLPEQALRHYVRIGRAFRTFLRTEVRWRGNALPLYKLFFANFDRLGSVAPGLVAGGALDPAARRLEQQAQEAIEAMLA